MQRNFNSWKADEEAQTSYTCGECGENFPKPLRATISSSGQSEIFYACPRCLTKVNVPTHQRHEHPNERAEQAEQRIEQATRPESKSERDANCTHFFGYLKQRPKDTPIPDTCLTCDRMVECMLH